MRLPKLGVIGSYIMVVNANLGYLVLKMYFYVLTERIHSIVTKSILCGTQLIPHKKSANQYSAVGVIGHLGADVSKEEPE